MIRVFSVHAYWSNTRRLRKEYIVAADKEDVLRKVEEMGGYRVLAI